MATEYTLQRADGRPFGSFEQVKARISQLFPSVQFHRTTSGPEKIALAAERGITGPPALMAVLPNLPSLLEGVAQGDGFDVTFGLGHQEPVQAARGIRWASNLLGRTSSSRISSS